MIFKYNPHKLAPGNTQGTITCKGHSWDKDINYLCKS